MWKKTFFCPLSCKFCVFCFSYTEWCFVCFSKLFDRLCVSVHPWGHGEGGCGVFDPPKQLSTLAQPKQLPQFLLPHKPGHLIPSIAHWAAEDVASRSRQVDLLDFNSCINATSFELTKKNVMLVWHKMLQEPRTAPPGWVLTIYNSVHRLDGSRKVSSVHLGAAEIWCQMQSRTICSLSLSIAHENHGVQLMLWHFCKFLIMRDQWNGSALPKGSEQPTTSIK